MNEKDMPIGVGVLVVKDGKILCGIRTDNGQVCGPGGHIEQGETPAQAAIRETQEEFGVKPLSLIPLGCLESSEGSYRPSKVYLCKAFDGEVNTDDAEMILPAYISIKDLNRAELNLHPAFEDSVRLLLKKLNPGKERSWLLKRLEKDSEAEELERISEDGGPGSGNWGHSGVEGQLGGSAPAEGGTAVKPDKETLRNELKGLREQKKSLLLSKMKENGEFTGTQKDLDELKKINNDIANKEYDLHSQLNPTVSDEKWKGSATNLSREEASVARQDMLKNKEMYVALTEASQGVSFVEGGETLDTELDALYKKDPSVYDLFEDSRKMLKQKYGDKVTLYRAGTEQTGKTTVNMTSSKANAQQYADIYGSKVSEIQVPVEDVLAINISRTGGYEEFVILNKK